MQQMEKYQTADNKRNSTKTTTKHNNYEKSRIIKQQIQHP